MKYKKIMFMLVLVVFLLSIAGVSASEIDNTIASENANTIELSADNDIEDNLQTSEENMVFTSTDYDEAIAQTDTEVLGADSATYFDLTKEIGQPGNINLIHKNYTYDGGEPITISEDNKVIDGNGAVIDMNGSTIRAFYISGSGVTIKNLTIINANIAGSGGAIYFSNSATSGTVSNCNFTNNTATSQGGAIRFSSTGTVTNCNFTNNSASTHGGAVFFSSTGNVSNCNFVDNKATGDYSYSGAVYFNDDGEVTNCNFTDNTAFRGGAVYFGNSGNVTNCNFVNNSATGEGSWGGAINIGSGTVSNCNFADNSASRGGAIFSMEWSTTADTCIFKRNSGDNVKTVIYPPTLNVNNFTTVYGSGEKLTFDLKTNSSIPVTNGNISISVYFKDGDLVGNYSCLSGEGWIPDLPVGSYIAFFDTEYAEFQKINRTITITAPEHTFWFLNYTINGNDNPVIELSHDFYFDPAYDAAFVNGIVINRPVTIKGNGNAIDAKRQARIFYVQSANAVLENLTIINANYNGDGGAIYFTSSATSGTVSNCNFVDNKATGDSSYGGAIFIYSGTVSNCNFADNKAAGDRSYGGAVYFLNDGNVTNCNFTDNTAHRGGAVYFNREGNVTNCNFTNNSASSRGGAVYFYQGTGTVSNCNFINNNATENGGAVYFSNNGDVTNCNFTGNNATTGSAIHFNSVSSIKTVSDSTFLNNRAKEFLLEVIQNENNITITFYGQNNLINAIYSNGDISFTNVTYWGANGITNTENSYPPRSINGAGQNITIGVVVNDKLVLNDVKVTDENCTIVLDISVGENYYIRVRHDTDSYYTEAEKTISNMTFNVNVTSQTTTNKTVNITAKSNIYSEVMPGKLLFILPNGTQIEATYGANGTWWAEHTFDAYGEYKVNATYVGLDNVTINNGTITINKVNSTIILDNIVLDYGESINVTVTTTGATGITAKIGDGEAKVDGFVISIPALDAGTYTLTVTAIADKNHNNITKNATITVNKLKTELTGNAITATYNINNDLVITLKDSNGKALSGVNVTVDLNGAKTYTTDSNGQVKVSTKGLAPKIYTAKVTFNGNTNYVKSTKDIKVTVKKATPKLTAKKKTFKTTTKTKKYTIVLKDNAGKAIKKAKVTLKVKGKTYKATTNSKGKATFKIKKLNKKGTFKAIVTYKGNKYYNKATKKAKIKVIVTFKTVSKGSKDKATVKEIQQALKNNGYYLTYDGHYLKIDGIYHGCTERSVKEFQHDKHLKVTGKVDEITAKKLGII